MAFELKKAEILAHNAAGPLPVHVDRNKAHPAITAIPRFRASTRSKPAMIRYNRNNILLLAIGIFVFFSIYLYTNLDSSSRENAIAQKRDNLSHIRKELQNLETIVKDNQNARKKLEQDIHDIEKEGRQNQIENENAVYDEQAAAKKHLANSVDKQIQGKPDHVAIPEENPEQQVVPEPDVEVPESGNKVAVVHKALKATTPAGGVCMMRTNYSHSKSDVQMLDMYEIMAFDNPDGGVWKQGWEITYDKSKVANEKKLEVVVIPHSHCDPGWIKTYEDYYKSQTKFILDGMAKHLDEKKDMRFIYAEMSFFETWWAEQTEATREKVISYLKSGQFEIVTGGWVMTDEANSHFFSAITELFEGHEFIRNHLQGYVPKAHWSIDPFGLSPSIPHLLSAANITNAVLQRVHYSVKKQLARTKQLEFMWRQLWGSHGAADVRTHMFPFYSYDIPHTCGPEPRVCCQFDFKRLPGGGHSCPWNVPPQEINAGNLEQRAFMIYDQYRKKNQLYKTNVLLVPLGDDFRYDNDFEWNAQYENYKKLFKYMNQKPEWNVHARFGTLSDYFEALDNSLKVDDTSLPVLTGDFFTYADRDDHYWSGYFTSRPFYKQMDRALQHYLRAAEIAFSLARMSGKLSSAEVYPKLVQARRAHSLFQHHDGVTGTAKDHVVIDYGDKMLTALNNCESVLSSSLAALASISSGPLSMSESRERQNSLPTQRVYKTGESLVLFNSMSTTRNEPVCVRVASLLTKVEGKSGAERVQISPVISVSDGGLKQETDQYDMCFMASLEPLATAVYKIVAASEGDVDKAAISGSGKLPEQFTSFDYKAVAGNVQFGNEHVQLMFDYDSGFLKSVSPVNHAEMKAEVNFVQYGARPHKRMNNGGGDDLSGAYLFLPDGDARKISATAQKYVVIDGPIVKRVIVAGSDAMKLEHMYTLYKDAHFVEIQNIVDVRSQTNFEVAMRIETNVESGGTLYTDLNGMQMIRRKRMLGKLPLQAHFYPMPASAYIEDDLTRVSLLGAQALGVASLVDGQLEVMLDRRLNQDDGRGLFQGVLDNHRTVSNFRLMIEGLTTPLSDEAARVGYLSRAAHIASQSLHYPWVSMASAGEASVGVFPSIEGQLPCDYHIVTMRTSASATDYNGGMASTPLNEAALVLHRPLPDCRSKIEVTCNAAANVNIKSLLPHTKSSKDSSLTMLYGGQSTEAVAVSPQDVKTVKLFW